MESDNATRTSREFFRQAGTGSLVTFRCDKCRRSMTTQGRKLKRPGFPAAGWLCRECV